MMFMIIIKYKGSFLKTNFVLDRQKSTKKEPFISVRKNEKLLEF